MNEFQPSFLQSINLKISGNMRLIAEMSRIKNSMHGLSPETREAWKAFKLAVWKDIELQKCQRDILSNETKGERKNVTAFNQAQIEKRKSEYMRDVARKIHELNNQELAEYSCKKCKDTGEKERVGLLVAFCPCPKGSKMLKEHKEQQILSAHPSWFNSDDGEFFICAECQTGFRQMRIHKCK